MRTWLHYLMKERRLPVNVDPADNRLANPRRACAPAGSVRARAWRAAWIRAADAAPAVALGQRTLAAARRAHVPAAGDSPIGLRLPLDSLPWIPAKEVPQVIPADPTVKRGALPEGLQRPARCALRRRLLPRRNSRA